MILDYESFINDKHFRQPEAGFAYKCADDSPLRDYQRASVEWALARGKAAIFKDTGLGKTLDGLEFGRAVVEHTQSPVLLLTPFCVGPQIHREAQEFGYDTKLIRTMDDVQDKICITNYENLHNINFEVFGGIVPDESSIMKGMQGKIRQQLTDGASVIPYRLSLTATPAPNDFMELGTQAEFLGIMTQVEMLATFFIHDGGDTAKWRLKGHGKQKFFEWLATWSIIMRDPSDYGFSPMPALPALNLRPVEVETEPTDGLFATVAQSLPERLNARRDTLEDRCQKAADIISGLDGPVLIWCGLNAEGDLLEKLIPGAVQVSGSDTEANKEDRLMGFSEGRHKILITKAKIAGFGMNWQHCNQMVFVGLSDSFEAYYQAIRRCWRQGQKRDVNVWVITADSEGAVVENIRRKQIQADTMMAEMAKIAASFFQDFDKAKNELRAYAPTIKAPKPQFLQVNHASQRLRTGT
ncbi:MAG TPA: DEAD/DEAH box helicase [Burkholderiaceae bacterium]|nr:DEAD/DEAH box helicase [Burkholderiaceae bacterium]